MRIPIVVPRPLDILIALAVSSRELSMRSILPIGTLADNQGYILCTLDIRGLGGIESIESSS